MDKDLHSIQEVRNLLLEAKKAQNILATFDQAALDTICKALSETAAAHAGELAQLACSETGFGVVADKTLKNQFAAVTVYNAIADLKCIGVLSEDKDRRTMDIGVPVGVIAALVPSTNPTSTVIYKSLIALKSGNPIVFSPHPGAV
ncbi:MAG: aldehyde dehydrogenase family protein, partial [Oscillospiraceae bacterium]